MLHPVELQRHYSENDQTQYAGEDPYNSFNCSADIRFDLMLYYRRVGYIFLLQSAYAFRIILKNNRHEPL